MPHISFAKICKDRGISVLSYDAVPEIADMLHLTPQCQGAATIIAEHPIILVDSRMLKRNCATPSPMSWDISFWGT